MITIILPTFNEAENIKTIIPALSEVFLKEVKITVEFENRLISDIRIMPGPKFIYETCRRTVE